MRAALQAAGAALALAAPLAPAQAVDIDWGGGAYQRRREVPAGKFAEVCGKVEPGRKVSGQYEAAAPLDFNVHYHEGRKVHYPVKHEGVQRAQGQLEAAGPQDYCWMWTNRGQAAVRVDVQLSRE